MKGVGEGEWATWDQVSREKGKGRKEEQHGGERREEGPAGEAGRPGSRSAAFTSVLELGNEKAREGGSARQTGNQR